MLMQKPICGFIRPRDRSAPVDLKDPYFHVSIFLRHRPVLRFAFEGWAYQCKVLSFGAVPIAPCLHESSEAACAFSTTSTTGSVSGSVMRTQGFGALAPQPVGPSSQLGKDQTLRDADNLFSCVGVGFGQSDSAPHAGTCSVLNCLNTFNTSRRWGCST